MGPGKSPVVREIGVCATVLSRVPYKRGEARPGSGEVGSLPTDPPAADLGYHALTLCRNPASFAEILRHGRDSLGVVALVPGLALALPLFSPDGRFLSKMSAARFVF